MSLPVVPPLCTICKHYSPAGEGTPVATCAAFPEGIPQEIWTSQVDHRQPYRGETITFELKDGIEEDMVEEWEQMFLYASEAQMSNEAGLPPLD